ncbi:MAG: hypothetical protein Q7T03_02565 [Deltaproteobacteria bacterium]|nr:hypothetical protein [Deltaproteobacteria bacterium]
MSLESININPVEIQRAQNQPSAGPKAKGMEFGDFLGGVSAMTPFATEFTRQSTGNVNAATVLNAAFTSFPGAAGSFSGAGGAPSWSAASSPYGPGSANGGIPGLAMGSYSGSPMGGASAMGGNAAGVSGGSVVPGTNMTQFQLMDVMNQNNLQLIELQAIMQSNMQVWNTKSNILSADHRAKLSMIEKFTARG